MSDTAELSSTANIEIVNCSFCSPEEKKKGRGVGLKLILHISSPYFWNPDSCLRHLHEVHSLPCVWICGSFESYARYGNAESDGGGDKPVLSTEGYLRVLLHIQECKDCHRKFLRFLRVVNEPKRRDRDELARAAGRF